MSALDKEAFLSRQKQVSVCLEGDNAILFDANTGREKVLNHSGRVLWGAMDGTAQVSGLARALALCYEVPLSDEVRNDASSLAEELVREGFAETNNVPRATPAEPEEYSLFEDAPHALDLSLTGRCNLRCAYCYYADEMVGRRDLPAKVWLTFFAELRSLAVRSLTLSGGEIFMRTDLWELIDGVVAGCMRFSINTNGTMISRETVDRLLEVGGRRRLDVVQVSIDGSCAEVHDQSRGNGSFERAMRGLNLLKESGLPVTVRVTVNRFNVDDLEATARLLLDEIGLASFSTNDAMPMGTGCTRQDTIIIAPEQRTTAMRTLALLERRYPGRINASAGSLALFRMFGEMEVARTTGQMSRRWKMGVLSSCGCMFLKLAVHHDGTVVPCNMLADATLGNIQRDSLREIWRKHPLLAELRGRKRLPMNEVPGCEGCEWTPYCNGGCPAVVYTQTGDLYRASPACCYRRFLAETDGLPNIDEPR